MRESFSKFSRSNAVVTYITYNGNFKSPPHLNVHQLKLRMIEFMQNVLKRNGVAYYEQKRVVFSLFNSVGGGGGGGIFSVLRFVNDSFRG